MANIDTLPRRSDAQHPIPFPEPQETEEVKHPVVSESSEPALEPSDEDPEDLAWSRWEDVPILPKGNPDAPDYGDEPEDPETPSIIGHGTELTKRQKMPSSYVPKERD